jgi:hypothetical protein
MSGFRRLIIGVAEFFQVISIFALTAGGGYAGYWCASLLESSPSIRDTYLGSLQISIGGFPARVVLFVILGALIGLISAASMAAILFALAQIEKNTRSAPTRLAHTTSRLEPRL